MGHGKPKDSVLVRTAAGELIHLPRAAAEKIAAQQAAEQAARQPSPIVTAVTRARNFLDMTRGLEAHLEGALLVLGNDAPEAEALFAYRKKLRGVRDEVERVHARLEHAAIPIGEKWLDEQLGHAREAAKLLETDPKPATDPTPAA